MRRVLAPVLPALVALLALAPAAGATTVTNRVVGGVTAAANDAPWQALVRPAGYLCGGSILDDTHVVTAAHCVYDPDNAAVVAPTDVTVTVGTTHRDGTGGTLAQVSAVTVYHAYNPDTATGDAAVLTLAAPIPLNGTTMQAIGLTDAGWRPLDGTTNLQLSGWGLTDARAPWDDPTGAPADDLQIIKTLHSTSTCGAVYGPDYDDGSQLCAGAANQDACQGDSGGPLAVQQVDGWKLAGIVSGGAGCGWAGYPGVYARVANAGIHDFLAARGAGSSIEDPYFTRQPVLSGDAVPYQTLSCDQGQAANAYSYETMFLFNGRVVSSASSVKLIAGDVGATVKCVSVAYGLSGTVSATTQELTVHWPAPSTGSQTTTQPPAGPSATPWAVSDTASPTSRMLRSHCTHTSCTLEVRVDDPLPSDGIKALEASVKTAYRTTCKVKVKGKRRTRACTKTITKKLKAVRTEAAATYRIVTPRLRKGRHTFTLVAVDVAGHRQAAPTVVKRTTA